jgi:hypothetical protein
MTLTPEDKQWISEQLSEQLEKTETKLLTAFHGWSGPTMVRIRSHSADIRAMEVDLEALQDRVSKLEENSH